MSTFETPIFLLHSTIKLQPGAAQRIAVTSSVWSPDGTFILLCACLLARCFCWSHGFTVSRGRLLQQNVFDSSLPPLRSGSLIAGGGNDGSLKLWNHKAGAKFLRPDKQIREVQLSLKLGPQECEVFTRDSLKKLSTLAAKQLPHASPFTPRRLSNHFQLSQ